MKRRVESIRKEAIKMGVQEYLQWWLNLSLNDIDFSIFLDFRILSIVSILFFLLKAKIGVIKALIFSPLSILLEKTMFGTLQATEESFFATLIFIFVTGILSLYVIYSLFIKDHASCNRC